MHPFHDRYPTDSRIALPFEVTAILGDRCVHATTAAHDDLVIAITADAQVSAADREIGPWYRPDTARVASDNADYDLELASDAALTDRGTTVND